MGVFKTADEPQIEKAIDKKDVLARLVNLESKQVPFLTDNYAKFVSIIRDNEKKCNPSLETLKEFDIGVKVMGKQKFINIDQLTKVLGISSGQRLLHVFPSERLLKTNIESYLALSFRTKGNDFIITVDDQEFWEAKPLDVIFVLNEETSGNTCYQNVRLFLARV